MSSHRSWKLYSQRPGSSARVYDYKNAEYDSCEKKSKIPKMPRRTYSLERKGSSYCGTRTAGKGQASTTSMIPRPEWKKYGNKVFPEGGNKKESTPRIEEPPTEPEKPEPSTEENSEEGSEVQGKEIVPCFYQTSMSNPQDADEFTRFKNNVLRIPEYWTDAGQTVTNILKNAINIVTKQYPSADVETFEMEIQNILKATEAVKQQILLKTESIIDQANKLYAERSGGEDVPGEDELKEIAKKMKDLRHEVQARKNEFGDLLKCSTEMKHLADLEEALKQNKSIKKSHQRGIKRGEDGQRNKELNQKHHVDGKKSKVNPQYKKKGKFSGQSCGDVKQDSETPSESGEKSPKRTQTEDKSCQTTNTWAGNLERRENLTVLNDQILELHQLCKDHISKFKSFNLQIKLRGICNKAQNLSVSKEIQILNDEKLQLAEKNNQLYFYNKDLESTIKQKDLDLHQKDRLISQQKKLLHVRDELIEMLKSRCHIEDVDHV